MNERDERSDEPTGRAQGSRRHHAGWLLAGGVGQAGLAFAANLVLVRFIAPEVFGRFALAYAGLSLVLSIASLRIGALVLRAPRDASYDPSRYWSALLFEGAFAALLCSAVLVAGGQLESWVAVLLAACIGKHVAQHGRAFLEREGRWPRLAQLEGLAQLVSHGAAVALACAGAGLGALVLREAVLAVAWLVLLGWAGGLPRSTPRRLHMWEWRALWRECRDVWFDGVLEGAFARAMVLAAGLVGGERGAGLFAQAHRLAFVPHQLLAPLVSRLAFAWFSAERDGGRLRRRMAWLLAGPLAALAGLGVWLGPIAIPLLFGREWSAVAPLFAALFGVILGISLLELCKVQFYAERRPFGLCALRAMQFGGLGAGFLLAPPGGVFTLCLGISAGTLGALAVAWALLEFRRPNGEQPLGRGALASDGTSQVTRAPGGSEPESRAGRHRAA